MKKLLLILLILSIIPIVFALEKSEIAIMPPIYPDQGVFSQNQYYSVNFDGEGEAAVAARIEFQNLKEENLTELTLEIPGQKIRMLYILQEYSTYSLYCAEWNPKGECVRYELRRDYPPKYKLIKYITQPTSKSILYNLKLPYPVSSKEDSKIILYYKSEDYAEKTLGVFNFDFETIKYNYDTNFIQIAVSVNPDLYLRGGKAKVDYRENFMGLEKAAASLDSQELQNFVWSIGSGEYTKTAQNLDPLESFHVKGKFASSRLNLYRNYILMGILAVLALVLIIIITFKKLSYKKANINIKAAIIGILSSIILISLWVLTSFLLRFIQRNIYYESSFLIQVLTILIVGIISLVFIFGPAIYFGIKHGLVPAIVIVSSLLISLIILGIVAILILSLMREPPIYPIYRTLTEAASVEKVI